MAKQRTSNAGINMQESRLGWLLYGGNSEHGKNAMVSQATFDASDADLSNTLR